MRKISIYNKFEKRKSGLIPKEWKIITLGEDNYANLIMGQSPPSSTYNDKGMGLPFLQGKAEFGEVYPRPIFSCSNPIKIAEINDILISVRAPVGDVNISPSRVCIGRGLAAIKCEPSKADYLFLFYYLKYEGKKFKNISSGSTFKAIRKNDLHKFELLLPTLPEQKKIAEILLTVDLSIEEVDKSITKTERFKKSLMHELLTKGIGHKEFKETEIGKIPKEWEVTKLGDKSIVEIRGNKAINSFTEAAFIPMEAIPSSDIFAKFEIRSKKDIKSFTYCKSGDILLAKITPSLENGKQGIVPNNIPCDFALATTEVFPIFCKNIEKLFLFYILKHTKFRNKIIASMIGTTGRQRASKISMLNLLIPLPPRLEQNKIAEILSTIDERIQLLKEKKDKLERIKKGLMHELLTGRKRVKVEA